MYSKPNLHKFFQEHPVQNSLELALDMIVRSAEDAKDSLESEDEDEFLYHLSKVHKMVEAIMTEVGTHPDAIKQHYPNGVPPKKRKETEDYKKDSYENPKHGAFRNPNKSNYLSGYKGY